MTVNFTENLQSQEAGSLWQYVSDLLYIRPVRRNSKYCMFLSCRFTPNVNLEQTIASGQQV